MVRRNSILALFVLVIVIFGNSCKKNDKSTLIYDRNFIDPIKLSRKELIAHMVTSEIPASSIAVSVEGKTIWSEAIGYANLELKAKATRETKFRIGSSSKIITSLVYHLLDERNTFGNDTLVSDYFEEFKNKKYPLPLHNLISETSGIRQPNFKESEYTKPGLVLQRDVHKFLNDTLLFEPGKFEYSSDFNYNLIGAIMEKKLTKRFGSIIKNVLLDTLQMKNTLIDVPQAIIENRATAYARNIVSQRSNAIFKDHTPSAPSIGMLSTADDLVKLVNALLYSDYFSDSFKKSYFEPFEFSDGKANKVKGWDILTNRNNEIVYSCKGTVYGGTAHLILFPEEKIVIAWLCNISTEYGELPIHKFLNHFINFQRGVSLEPEKE